ncbi:MAG TPA: hypothetical protein DDZ41_09100, partial [Flavobacterium sp.]|nr:hypothetical protein [Flavobacterium sp.]
MKIIILTSSSDMRYARGSDRVIHYARETLNKEFDQVLYLTGNSIYKFCIGIIKIIINNPFTFNFIIYNAQSSLCSKSNPYWIYYYFISWIFRIKTVVYWHEMPYFVENKTGKSKFILWLFKNKKIIQLCCSEANKHSAFVFDKNPNITNINNCIIPRKTPKIFLLSKFTVITIGSFDLTKGADIWTEVAINVCNKNDEIQFIWCGDGVKNETVMDECKQKVVNSNFEDRISFLGRVEDAAVLTSAAHLYFSSSRLDSFPLSVLEAMSFGKNIIHYESGGVKEQVGDYGICIENFDCNKTATAILKQYDAFVLDSNSVFNKNLYNRYLDNYTL